MGFISDSLAAGSQDSLGGFSYSETMKKQERVAIRAILNAQKTEIVAEGSQLTADLSQKAADMKTFASTTLPGHLTAALEGQSANAAHDHLTSMAAPPLASPIKAQ